MKELRQNNAIGIIEVTQSSYHALSASIIVFLTLWGLLSTNIINAQEVVLSSGGTLINNNLQANWSIGELITETMTNSDLIMTSGINQPLIAIETSVTYFDRIRNVSLFPNPTSNFLIIKQEGQEILYVKVLSPNGTILSNKELINQSLQIDFTEYTCGVYIIEVTDKLGKSNSYKIVKQ